MRYLVSGAAGFVGYHTSEALLRAGHEVLGIDNFSDYYDPDLKRARNARLERHPGYQLAELSILDIDQLVTNLSDYSPDRVIHLAAQPGVRYSLENPHAYIETNIVGTLNLLQAIRNAPSRVDQDCC